jgi:hypothetical protein
MWPADARAIFADRKQNALGTRLSNLTYLSIYNYHLFTETEGNGVFCGPETVEELQYQFYMSDLAGEIGFFHSHGRIRILWPALRIILPPDLERLIQHWPSSWPFASAEARSVFGIN